MRSFAFLARYRLLLCIFLLSLLLHVAMIALLELRVAWPAVTSTLAVTTRLDVRLAQARSASSAPAAPVLPSVPEPDVAFVPLPGVRFDPAPLAPPPPTEPAPEPVIYGFASTPAGETVPDTADDMVGLSGGGPGYYQSSPPYSAQVDYRVTRTGRDTPPRDDGAARLVWETDGSTYRLELDGILGDLSSEGGLDDRGIAPQRALEPLGAGRATTLFERREERIVNALGAWRAPLFGGSQDTASVLLQLTGMGRSLETQLHSVMKFWVAGGAGARLERYRMKGRETIETGIGTLETVRIARLNPPDAADAPQLDIWFAPRHGWLPVQLQLTAGDGQVRTQTVTGIRTDSGVPP